MPPANLPEREDARLAALHALQILDTPQEERFDLFARLAADIAETPIAAISLVDRHRQWFKAAVGLEAREMPRGISFCAEAILDPGQPLIVEDATTDQRFAANPLVRGQPGIRFYCGSPLVQRDGHAIGALCVIDTVPRRLTERQLRRLADLARGVMSTLELHGALHTLGTMAAQDRLTGCANRGALELALAPLAGPMAPPTAVLSLDLDRFKVINDLLGHAAGDAVLIEVARRLKGIMRHGDLVARLGADEFVVVAGQISRAGDAAQLAQRIHAVFVDPFSFEGQPILLRASVGLALFPADAPTGAATLQLADAALYQAKRAGRCTARHGQAPEPGSCLAGPPALPAAGRDEIAGALRAALSGDPAVAPLALAWQPIFTAGSPPLLMGAEALLRWPRRPGEAPLNPGDFLPAAERHGLMARLDRWVLRCACREAAGWPVPVGISVNLSAANFLTVDLVAAVEAALADSGLPASRLTLEVTESALIGDMGRARATLGGLREIGVGLALDDFGTGHSSLAYLRDLPFDKVKIDRSFIGQLAEDPRAPVLVRAIVQLARGLGLGTIAEGVETPQQMALLQAEGVDGLQGFLLGLPGPASQLLARVPGQGGGAAFPRP